MSTRLVADVGGTNTRIALFTPQSGELSYVATYINRDYPLFEDVIEAWLTSLPHKPPTKGCIAVAAPPSQDVVSMINMDWSFSSKALAQRFGLTHFRRINDFEANAYALPHLTQDDRIVLHCGGSTDNNKLAVIGPGTGLGGATIEPAARHAHANACEPGHMSLSPVNPLEIEVFQILLKEYSQIYAELLVSGPGLLRLYKTLCEVTDKIGDAQTPAEVSRRALEQHDETSVLALSMFSALLGSLSADFVLANGTYGGLFLAGGIVPKLIPFLAQSDFHLRFRDKGAMGEVLNRIPVYIITTAQPGLIGAAHAPI